MNYNQLLKTLKKLFFNNYQIKKKRTMKNKNYFTGTPFENIKGEVEIEFQNETYLAEVFFGENPHVNIWEGNTIIFVLKKDEKKGWICFTFFGNHKLEVCIDIQEITVKILIK